MRRGPKGQTPKIFVGMLMILPHKVDGQTNRTDYIDPYATHMDRIHELPLLHILI